MSAPGRFDFGEAEEDKGREREGEREIECFPVRNLKAHSRPEKKENTF
jgi:hypothetical protein